MHSASSDRILHVVGIGQLATPIPPADGTSSISIQTLRNVRLEICGACIERICSADEPLQPGIEPDAIYDAEGGLVTPGLVDAHTHPAFAGYRENEFILRCQGKGYLDIAAAGGGILSSMRGVRGASEEQLTKLIQKRFLRFIASGVTSIEAKSGYGLSLDDELKSLRAIGAAAKGIIDVSPTLLAAHTPPPEYAGRSDNYISLVCEEIIPRAAEEGLAEAVDVFVEETAFNLAQASQIFDAADRYGLGKRIHADQFSCGGGARLAAERGALSADHMDFTSEADLHILAKAGVPIGLLPGAVFFLGKEHYASGRTIADLGCRYFLSTDFNPGTSPTQSLLLMMTLGCVKMKLTPEEAFTAVTLGGAAALGSQQRAGTIAVGEIADLCIWDAPGIDFLPYAYANVVPKAVFRQGELVAREGVHISNLSA